MLKLLQIFPFKLIFFLLNSRKARGGDGIKKRLQIDVKNDDSLDLESEMLVGKCRKVLIRFHFTDNFFLLRKEMKIYSRSMHFDVVVKCT